MSALDAKSQNLLQLDPSNPAQNTDGFSKSTSSRPDSAASRRPKPSIKEAIAQQKKLKQQKMGDELPSRPASAMSAIMDSRPTPKSAVRPHAVQSSTTTNITSSHSLAQSASSGSLMSAPMRPPIRPVPSRKIEGRHEVAENRSKAPELEGVTITSTVPHPTSQKDRPTFKSSATSPDKAGSKSVLSEKPSLKSSATSPEKQLPKVSTAKKPPMSPPKPKKTVSTPVSSPSKPKIDHKKSASVASLSSPGKTAQRKIENEPPVSPTKRGSLIPHAKTDSPSTQVRPDEDLKVSSSRDRPVSGDSFGSPSSLSSIPMPAKAHSRQDSDDLGQSAEPIKVYEDPMSAPVSPAGVAADQTIGKATATPPANVLEDLPINPRNDLAKSPANGFGNDSAIESPLNGRGHPDPSDEKLASRRWQKAEMARPQPVRPRSKDRGHNQGKLRKYIEGIRNKNIDVMGFRKLQGIIFDHDEFFEDEVLFDDMVLALLGLLETPHQGTKQFLGRAHDQKESALSTLKLIMDKQPKYIKAYYARSLAALIVGRQYFENASHIVSGFESLANRVLRDCSPFEAMDTVLDTLILQENNEATDRSMIMGTSILSGLLWKSEPNVVAAYEGRLSEVARNGFQRGRPAIRRSMVQFAKTLSAFIKPEARFFSMVAGGDPDLKSLLTYYMNVRG